MAVPAIAAGLLSDLVGGLAAEVVRGVSVEAVGALDLKATVDLDLQKFERLRKGVRIGVIRAANRAAKPLRASVTAHAQSIARFGFLAKSIGTKTRIYPKGSIVTVIGPKMSYKRVKGKFTRGPRKGESRNQVPYRYAWLLEKGTKRSRKRPFVQRTYDSMAAGYRADLVREIEAELSRLLG